MNSRAVYKHNNPDVELEADIEAAFRAGIRASTPELARECFNVMSALIAKRSPQRVRKMEIERFGRAF